MNRDYLKELRSHSCYPTFRAVVLFATAVAYIGAAVFALISFSTGQGGAMVLGIVVLVATVLIAQVVYEATSMLADIADATIAAAAPATMQDEPMQQCPYCAENVLAAAIKCKHCASDLSTDVARLV